MSTSNESSDSKARKRNPLKPPHRRLVVMFDGTGNKRMNLSNVARMFEAIDDSKPCDYEPYTKVGPGSSCDEDDVLEPEREPAQMVKYIKGVGTDEVGHLSGLGFGYGLSANVIAGYVWLSNNYYEGDEIFVFGFSRGSFSARSLVSLVHRCGGVLKNKSVSAENDPKLNDNTPIVLKAYAMYEAYVQTTTADGTDKHDVASDRDHYNTWHDFQTTTTKDHIHIHPVTIKMLGVWDTVGAVGIPETGWKFLDDHVWPMSRYSSKRYQFHDQGLSCIVENAYHALALDEHRKQFAPTLWDSVTPKNEEVKQAWFVGSHCNVGGGADLADLNDPDDLWQYSYVWMQKHAAKHGLRFYWTYDSPPTQSPSPDGGPPSPTRRVSLRTPEDSYALFLNGYYKYFYGPFDRVVDETNGAKLHWSAADRIIVSVKQSDKLGYCPKSLFGKYGTQFAKVTPDKIELSKLDTDTPGLVSMKLWQIETDDAVETTEPLHHLPMIQCTCGTDPVAPAKPTGFWRIFGL